MKIFLNGDLHTTVADSTVAELLTELGLDRERVAVEMDREIVPRVDWPRVMLREECRVEVVHFVGGGEERR